jgi:hypothetical protein
METESKFTSLKKDRKLAFAEYGDPTGTPVFFFHSMPGSRYFHPPDEITARLHVRLISWIESGMGNPLSSPKDAYWIGLEILSSWPIFSESGNLP